MKNAFYYIDKSVLVENRPLVKFIRKLHPGLEWRIFHILTSEDIDDVMSCFYTVVFPKILVYVIKRKLHGGLKT